MLLKVLQSNLSGPTLFTKGANEMLEDLFVAIPETPWIYIDLVRNTPKVAPEGLKRRRIELIKYQPGAPSNRSSFKQPVKASLEVNFKTVWVKPTVIDGVTRISQININTLYHYWPSSQESESTVAGDVVSAQRQKREHLDNFEEILFDLHCSIIRSVLSGEHADIDDIVHRLALTAFLLNDSEPQTPPLESITIHMQNHRQYKSSEEYDVVGESPVTSHPVGCYCTMPRTSYEQVKHFTFDEAPHSDSHVAHVALGSNVGDRISMIELACKSMEAQNLKVIRTSALYETAPMYLEEQAPFINGVCQVSAEAATPEYSVKKRYILDRNIT